MSDLAGKRVLITGGAGGVGRAVAGRMVASGARVLIADRGELDLRAAVEHIGGGFGEIDSVTADLSGASGLARMFERVDGWLGGLDILVACAGVGLGPLMEMDDGNAPVAPSAIRAATKTFVNGGSADVSEPRALAPDEIPGIVESFRSAAANAIEAGFDGVEVHGANGYLLDQFAKDGANQRIDAYGGSVENRARLLLAVTAAVAGEVGVHRTGVRLSPISPANGILSSDPQAQFDHIVEKLDALGIAYIHVVEDPTGGPRDVAPFDFDTLRKKFRNTYIANNGYDRDLAAAHLAGGKADLFAFGRPFVANPDLVARLKSRAPLAMLNPATLYGGGSEGYIDYPVASAAER